MPTAEREFRAIDLATATFYVYQRDEPRAADRDLAAAVPAHVTVRITDARDAVALEEQHAIGPDRFATKEGLRMAEFRDRVPLEGLAQGRHLLTFEVQIGEERRRRDVQFSVR